MRPLRAKDRMVLLLVGHAQPRANVATCQEAFALAGPLGLGCLDGFRLRGFRGHDFGQPFGITDRRRKGPLLAESRRSSLSDSEPLNDRYG